MMTSCRLLNSCSGEGLLCNTLSEGSLAWPEKMTCTYITDALKLADRMRLMFPSSGSSGQLHLPTTTDREKLDRQLGFPVVLCVLF